MNHYPYLTINHTTITTQTTTLTLKQTLKTIHPDQPLYLIDHDGITHNRPNYNTYQRLSTKNPLWIDAGPRTTDDIVDLIMAGATTIIIRPTLYHTPDLHETHTITDLDLYTYFNTTDTPIPLETTGLIIPTPPPQIPLAYTSLPRYLLSLDPTTPLPKDDTYQGIFLDPSLLTTPEDTP
jgi:hypothetical protein